MRKKIVAGNWKMNKTLDEGLKLTSEIVNMTADEVNNDAAVIIAPPFVHLTSVRNLVKGQDKVFLGAQNCHGEESGAYTGEISAGMLASAGVSHVILGHSERREYFQETNKELATKVNTVLSHGLTPIFCCGESLDIRENGDFEEDMAKIVIAYEPIWAIGTGKTASSAQAQEMHAALRKYIAEAYSEALAESMSILYGGSCKPSNAKELFSCQDVDGGLIGGASLSSRDFVDIIKSF